MGWLWDFHVSNFLVVGLAFITWCLSGLGQYASHLQFASDAKVFHAAHPVGMHFDASPVQSSETKAFPNFARESLEKACIDVLIPVLTFKKQSSLHGYSNAAQIPSVKDPSNLKLELNYVRAAALRCLMLRLDSPCCWIACQKFQ